MLAIVLNSPETSRSQDWPMLAHDCARSGATPTELRPPFQRKWFRLFTEEGLMSGVQPIVADHKVFIGTLHGKLHAIDTDTGKDAWSFPAGAAVLHTAGWTDGRVIFGTADGAVHALNSSDGTPAWEVQTGSAVWNAPALCQGVAYIGSRDGQLYAIDARTGDVKWTAPTDGPLLGSPAVDPQRERVYVPSEDMRVYAFELKDGGLVWRSEPLPGVSLRGYHPVVAPDGSVLVTSAPGISVDTFPDLLLRMIH